MQKQTACLLNSVEEKMFNSSLKIPPQDFKSETLTRHLQQLDVLTSLWRRGHDITTDVWI